MELQAKEKQQEIRMHYSLLTTCIIGKMGVSEDFILLDLKIKEMEANTRAKVQPAVNSLSLFKRCQSRIVA